MLILFFSIRIYFNFVFFVFSEQVAVYMSMQSKLQRVSLLLKGPNCQTNRVARIQPSNLQKQVHHYQRKCQHQHKCHLMWTWSPPQRSPLLSALKRITQTFFSAHQLQDLQQQLQQQLQQKQTPRIRQPCLTVQRKNKTRYIFFHTFHYCMFSFACFVWFVWLGLFVCFVWLVCWLVDCVIVFWLVGWLFACFLVDWLFACFVVGWLFACFHLSSLVLYLFFNMFILVC